MRHVSTTHHAGTPLHRFAHEAMATTFEILLPALDLADAASAAHAAFEEADRLEAELSRFIAGSDINRLATATPGEPVRIGWDALHCLELAQQAHALTHGAFDITLGALTDFWRALTQAEPLHDLLHAELSPHDAARWAQARARTGLQHLILDPENFTATVLIPKLTLDLGAIGKGHAVDCLLATLREWGLAAALVHSGQSSALGLGDAPGAAPSHGWRAALRNPHAPAKTLCEIPLGGRSLSGSGIGLHGPHIIDPRTARSALRRSGAWLLAPSAALSDALSTACMLLSDEEIAGLVAHDSILAACCLAGDPHAPQLQTYGSWPGDIA
jgi:thiamine biosynthesis lipoprotein